VLYQRANNLVSSVCCIRERTICGRQSFLHSVTTHTHLGYGVRCV